MSDPQFLPSTTDAAGDAAFALELLRDFFAGQIDAGAALREEIAAHINACADRVAERDPTLAHRATMRAVEMIDQLPAGWAEGDKDWTEPA